jgi:stage II sporulation protein D
VNRKAFAASIGAAIVGFPQIARATGGLEIGGRVSEPAVRVLLARGSNIPMPAQLDAWHFLWSGETYRGDFAFVRLADGKQGLINVLPLDSYLYGVSGAEVSTTWPSEVQKAQAILSRTYVMRRSRVDRPYDVLATDGDQSYCGIDGESVERHAAVDMTAGKIVTYEKRPASVAFSACCGGRTADPGDAGPASVPYLRSFVDPHCVGTLYHHWEVRVPYASIAGRLDLERAGALRSVTLRNFGNGLRPRQLRFAGTDATIDVDVDTFRAAAGFRVVRSTFLRAITPTGRELLVGGNGFGHGVGMCQWGARAMAASGASAAEIIAFYFPKTAIA